MDDPQNDQELQNILVRMLPQFCILQQKINTQQLPNNLTLQELIMYGKRCSNNITQETDNQVPVTKMQFIQSDTHQCTVRSKDIPVDGYFWVKYGQKLVREQNGQQIRAYFKCQVPQCRARRTVSYNRETGQLRSSYDNNHSHERHNILIIKANSYEEYLIYSARVQQFEYKDLRTNGYQEPTDPITQDSKISTEFPLKLQVTKQTGSNLFEALPKQNKKYIAQIIINFKCEQDFSNNSIKQCKETVNQELIEDGFIFMKNGYKQNDSKTVIYLKCNIHNCKCVKKIENVFNRKEMTRQISVTYESQHNHPANIIFNVQKYKQLHKIYRFDEQQQALINVTNLYNTQTQMQLQTAEQNNVDFDNQGVLTQINAYVYLDDQRQKINNMMGIYDLEENDNDQDEEVLRQYFNHI